jgi:MoaA/NifB/PqqE/SkfB family radical SAM enzyme
MTLSKSEIEAVDTLRRNKPLAAAKAARFDDQLAAGKSIALIQLQYKYACNFHCSHCSIAGFRANKYDRALTIPVVKYIFDQADAYGLAHMGISGGEPLVFADLDQLIEAIGPDRFHIQLDTNGWMMTPEKARRMKMLGVDKVQISIDGVDAEEHDAFRRRSGSHGRAMAAIDAVLGAGLAVQVATVVGHDRAQSTEFLEFMQMMHKRGAPVSVVYAKPVGEYAGRFDQMCTSEDIAHVKRLLKEYGGYDHTTPGYGRDLGCTAVKRIVSITAFGDVLPCPWMYWSLGNVFDTPLADILDKGMRYFGDRSPVCRLSEDAEFNRKYTSKVAGLDYVPTIEEVMGD